MRANKPVHIVGGGLAGSKRAILDYKDIWLEIEVNGKGTAWQHRAIT
jgi:folate-dependent tRNA-U54 methylase TrmFO/GidA